jgi:hypothetical protein
VQPIHCGQLTLRRQPEIRFVNEGGRLQRVPRTFLLQVPARAFSQFIVDEREKALGSRVVTAAPLVKQLCDLMRGSSSHIRC